MIRTATAVWQGDGKTGTGHLSTQSTVLNNTAYSFNTRFAEGIGTNPEELLAAAHAGCFTMKLSFNLAGAGFTAERLETSCAIALDNGSITKSALTLTATVPDITAEQFAALVQDAELNCPVSKLLKAEITVAHTLVPSA